MNTHIRPMRLGIPQTGLAQAAVVGSERRKTTAGNGEMIRFDVRRRFWVSVALTLPLVILAVSARLRGLAFESSTFPTAAGFLALVVATPVVLWGGWPLFVVCWKSIVARKPTIIAAAGVAVAVAYLSGAIAILFPKIFTTFLDVPDGLPPVYFTAAAVMTVLTLLGRYLTSDADDRMSASVEGRSLESHENGLVVAAVRRGVFSIAAVPDRVAGVITALVVAAAAAAFIAWFVWGPEPTTAYALASAVAVLIIASPCALGLAKPSSFAAVAAAAADSGVQFESAAAIEAMSKADTLVIDKTGVLTEGRLRLATVEPANMGADQEFLRQAASLEKSIDHPLARAVVVGARERGLELVEVGETERVPGMGVVGTIDKSSVIVGGASLIEGRAALSEKVEGRAEQLCADGQSVLFVAVDGVVVGILGIEDPLTGDAREVVRQLHAEGMEVAIITGDGCATAEAVAHAVGIDQVHTEVMRKEKTEVVRRIREGGRTVAVVCSAIDGVPAAVADETTGDADVILTGGDLRAVLGARRLSRAATEIVRQNTLFALIFTSLGVPVVAGALYPAFGWLPSPMIALTAMTIASMVVIGNALRLRRLSLEALQPAANH